MAQKRKADLGQSKRILTELQRFQLWKDRVAFYEPEQELSPTQWRAATKHLEASDEFRQVLAGERGERL